ncbi:MAG TPA: ChbG/HpnK family deacetylase [Terracidiphilus sp.]|nr:ChbG/HpnK family deacetylase [Terracidiphilus sp.]
MSSLIVNADDFGLTSGVNRAILELHRRGVLTSATLMACAAATDEAVAIAKATPTLGVGCHVVLVDGKPALESVRLATLAPAGDGCLRPTLGKFVKDLFTGRIAAAEIEAEAQAQIARLQTHGVELTHIDTHKHTHMFPAVLRPLLRAARACGVRAVRNPFEPAWSVRATPNAPMLRRAQVRMLRSLQARFRRIVAEEGFTTTSGAIGVLATGSLDAQSLHSLLQRVPDGVWELVTHPGYNDATLAGVRTRLRESRETEMRALEQLREHAEMKLISFRELQP